MFGNEKCWKHLPLRTDIVYRFRFLNSTSLMVGWCTIREDESSQNGCKLLWGIGLLYRLAVSLGSWRGNKTEQSKFAVVETVYWKWRRSQTHRKRRYTVTFTHAHRHTAIYVFSQRKVYVLVRIVRVAYAHTRRTQACFVCVHEVRVHGS